MYKVVTSQPAVNSQRSISKVKLAVTLQWLCLLNGKGKQTGRGGGLSV